MAITVRYLLREKKSMKVSLVSHSDNHKIWKVLGTKQKLLSDTIPSCQHQLGLMRGHRESRRRSTGRMSLHSSCFNIKGYEGIKMYINSQGKHFIYFEGVSMVLHSLKQTLHPAMDEDCHPTLCKASGTVPLSALDA